MKFQLWDTISGLDTIQALGNWLIPQTEDIATKRISNAKYYDHLSKIKWHSHTSQT